MVINGERQNIYDVIEDIKGLVGKKVTAIVSETTGGTINDKVFTFLSTFTGVLVKFVENKDNPLDSRLTVATNEIMGNAFPILGAKSKPEYQFGVVLLMDENGKVVCGNLDIANNPRPWNDTVENNYVIENNNQK